MKMQLKNVPFTHLFTISGEQGNRRIDQESGRRNHGEGKYDVFCCPAHGQILWTSRGIWVDSETEVELAKLSPYEAVMAECPIIRLRGRNAHHAKPHSTHP